MAPNFHTSLTLNETELNALTRIAKPKLFKYMADISGPYRARTLINGGNDYAGLREYSPGDEVRSINWRASARSRDFQVHQHQQEKCGRWFICLDASASMSVPEPQKWRLAVELADAFAFILLSCGNQVGFTCFNDELVGFYPTGSSRLHYKKLNQHLHQLKPKVQGGQSLLSACLPQIRQKTSVVVIGDFLQPDLMIHSLDKFRRLGHHLQVLQVLSQHETSLPADGLLQLADIESGISMLVESNDQAQLLADTLLNEQTKTLEDYCHQHRFNYSLATSDLYWQTVMLNHLKQL